MTGGMSATAPFSAGRLRNGQFCTFNGLVIAAHEALRAGADRVLIIDLDAHCGGGTASLIRDELRIWQLDVSVNSYDSYEVTQRTWLQIVTRCGEYLGEIERGLKEVESRWPRFKLCIYNAGMDPYEECSVGGLAGITREILAARERLVFAWCREQGIPVAFVVAGGYLGQNLDEAGLVRLHRLTLSAAADAAL